MDDRRGSNRLKRPVKIPQEGFWDCSVCTYKNPPEAFKCEICDVRKGTSTRKPRLNQELVAQQVAPQLFVPPMIIPKKERTGHHGKSHSSKEGQDIQEDNGRPPKLRNIDRSTARHMEVTVDNVTVIITDYQPKTVSSDKDDSSDLDFNLNSDSNDGIDRLNSRENHNDSVPEASRS